MRANTLIVFGVVLAAGLGVAFWFGKDAYATAQIGTTYVAKQTCSCLFVAGRSADSCKTDYNASDLARLKVESDATGVSVTALAGLVSARAEHETGFGCHPVK